MRFVISASKKNIDEGSGGPFAAAVFEKCSGQLIALGVNLVVYQALSILHAEMVAITLAQKKLSHFDLGGQGLTEYELFISAEPCAMCLGAIPWSGISHVVTAALGRDVEAIGFDEGMKPELWTEPLTLRNIRVTTGIERENARAVLQRYQENGGLIYNSRIK